MLAQALHVARFVMNWGGGVVDGSSMVGNWSLVMGNRGGMVHWGSVMRSLDVGGNVMGSDSFVMDGS